MPIRSLILVVALLAACGAVSINAQATGSLEISGRVRVNKKLEKLTRKRFYLFRGGLEANKALIDRIKASKPVSRDCYYCQIKASPEYIAWLKAEDCESPYCRKISDDDVKNVPEFQAAYQKGIKQYKNKPNVARDWLTTSLPTGLRDGYYLQQHSLVESVLGGIKPLQSSMTDSVSVKAIFIDIPLSKAEGEMFTISNVVPLTIGDKSYTWACEIEIGSDKKVTLPLAVPENEKPVKRCEVIVRDLPACGAEGCATK